GQARPDPPPPAGIGSFPPPRRARHPSRPHQGSGPVRAALRNPRRASGPQRPPTGLAQGGERRTGRLQLGMAPRGRDMARPQGGDPPASESVPSRDQTWSVRHVGEHDPAQGGGGLLLARFPITRSELPCRAGGLRPPDPPSNPPPNVTFMDATDDAREIWSRT